MTLRLPVLCALTTGLALLAAVPAQAKVATPKPRAAIAGGAAGAGQVCGINRSVRTVVGQGAKASASGRRSGSRKGKRRLVLVVDKCTKPGAKGRFKRLSSRTLGTGTKSYSRALSTIQTGDYRVRVLAPATKRARGKYSKTLYLRVSPKIMDVPISFRVQNTNRSKNPCASDNQSYTVRGHLTGPTALIKSKGARAATVYMHGHSFGEFLWRYRGVPGYDTTYELAKLGHVSVTYDRLGYESSDKPNGYLSCYGSEADVAHQIVDQVRAGSYARTDSGPVASFGKVAFAGHSQGAFAGEAVPYSFKNVDAYIHMSFDDGFISPSLGINYGENVRDCEGSPLPADQKQGNPTGYAFRGPSAQQFKDTNFFDIDPTLLAKLTAIRNVDPCGFPRSAVPTAGFNNVNKGDITVPVLAIFGDKDTNLDMPAAAANTELGFKRGSKDVTLKVMQNTGHTMMFERTAPQFREILSSWLAARGF